MQYIVIFLYIKIIIIITSDCDIIIIDYRHKMLLLSDDYYINWSVLSNQRTAIKKSICTTIKKRMRIIYVIDKHVCHIKISGIL